MQTKIIFLFILANTVYGQVDTNKNFCSHKTYDMLEFVLFWSGDDPDVLESLKYYKSLCRDVSAGTISMDEAREQFRADLVMFIVPVIKEIGSSGKFISHLKFAAFGASKLPFINRKSAIYWVIYIYAFICIIILAIILFIIAWITNFFGPTLPLSDFLKNAAIILIITNALVFWILVIGQFIHFLNIIAVILGIIGSIIGIAVGISKLSKSGKISE